MGNLNMYEIEQLKERTVAAMGHLRRANRRISAKIPLGFDLAEDGETLRPNAEEQDTITWIVEARSQGVSLSGIAARLTDAGRKTKYGARWHAATVKAILSRNRKLTA
jgi:hypothetical protein